MNKVHLMDYRKEPFARLLALQLIPAIRNKAEIIFETIEKVGPDNYD